MNEIPLLSILTLIPFVGGIMLIGLGEELKKAARTLAVIFSVLPLAMVFLLLRNFDAASGALQFKESHDWIPFLGVQYHLGADGLSLVLLLLTAIVVPMSVAASWNVRERAHIYFALVFFLQATLFGTFTALNFFHWFLFFELSLVPAFFLIKLWGGPFRSSAATQFFVYTMVGSVGMLLAFLAIFLSTGKFDFTDLADIGQQGTLAGSLAVKLGWYNLTVKHLGWVIFGGALLGFAVKTPMVPFHTWLPETYAEAPTGTTMLLTGLMSKMGVYGFLRILMPIFSDQIRMLLTPLLWLAVISIVYSAGAAFAQRDLKRMLGYSSINHLGYCVLAIFAVTGSTSYDADAANDKAAALNGVILQLFNHGLTAALLFWFVGMLEARGAGARGLHDFGGLRKVIPVFCGLMGIALFSSLGLPGLNGFIGEFLIFRGTFPLSKWATCLAVLGLLITAIFILTILQRVFYGPLNQKWARMPDLTLTERALVAIPIALMFLLGLYPRLILDITNGTVMQMVRQLKF